MPRPLRGGPNDDVYNHAVPRSHSPEREFLASRSTQHRSDRDFEYHPPHAPASANRCSASLEGAASDERTR